MSQKEKFYLSTDCFYEDIDNSLFLLHSKTGQYHELNETGKSIIKALDSNILSINEILHEINQSKHELSRNDVANFLDQLLAREIIYLKK